MWNQSCVFAFIPPGGDANFLTRDCTIQALYVLSVFLALHGGV